MLKVGETKDTRIIVLLRKDQVRPLPTKRARVGTSARISRQRPIVSYVMDHIGHVDVLRGRPSMP